MTPIFKMKGALLLQSPELLHQCLSRTNTLAYCTKEPISTVKKVCKKDLKFNSYLDNEKKKNLAF